MHIYMVKLREFSLNGALFGLEEQTNICLVTCLQLFILETALIRFFCYLGSVEYYFKACQSYLTAGPNKILNVSTRLHHFLDGQTIIETRIRHT